MSKVWFIIIRLLNDAQRFGYQLLQLQLLFDDSTPYVDFEIAAEGVVDVELLSARMAPSYVVKRISSVEVAH